jgi:hypothetical protein
VSTGTPSKKRPWWQRGPLTALWLALLLAALAHTKPLVDSGLATEDNRAALRAFAIQFAVLTAVMSISFWLGTIPHAGNRGRLRVPGSARAAASQMPPTHPGGHRKPWQHLQGYRLASEVGFVLGLVTVGFFLAPDAIADGRITILELGLAVLVFLAVLWGTLSAWSLRELSHDSSLQLLVHYFPDPQRRRGLGLALYTLLVGAPMAGAELLPESLAYLWSRPAALLRRFRKTSPDT